ncbi:hypothetical protein B0H11DRAFT_1714224, partial [Mycena galericulata]
GLVTLQDAEIIFPESDVANSGRTLVRPKSLSDFEVLCNSRAEKITIQASTQAFEETFNRMSDGLLKNVDWNNLFVAGGIVLGALLSVDRPAIAQNSTKLWESSDIDIYVYGLPSLEATNKMKHVYDIFQSNLPLGTPSIAVKNSKTVTFYAQYPLRRIQIVLKLVNSPKDVLLNFDLDICSIGWNGSEVLMLPRAARALETGRNLFTMNLIHGHYLSERRASQPQRQVVFKYANKGYGIYFLPSYMESLARSTANTVDPAKLGAEARSWTKQRYADVSLRGGSPFRYSDLDDSEIRQSCLAYFTLFMRHVAYWEIEQLQDINSLSSVFLFTWYSTGESLWAHIIDDHRYKWDELFSHEGLKAHINRSNRAEVDGWIATDEDPGRLLNQGVDWHDPLKDAQRMTYASSLDDLLDSTHDIRFPVLLPCDLAAYVNKVVNKGQAKAHLPIAPVLKLAGPGQSQNLADDIEGLYMWSIGSHLMWQQIDRGIDEAFEVLKAFHRVNQPMQDANSDSQIKRVVAELAKRNLEGTDEFDAFRRWIGR